MYARPGQAPLQRPREQAPSAQREAGDAAGRGVEDRVLDLCDGVTRERHHRQGGQAASGHQFRRHGLCLRHHTPPPPYRRPRRTAITVPDRLPAWTPSVTSVTTATAATTRTSHTHQTTVHLRPPVPAAVG